VCTDPGATGESASICYHRYRSQKKLDKEKDSTPPKVHGDVAEMVKILANTPPVSNKKLVKRQEKPKGEARADSPLIILGLSSIEARIFIP
jgi:hypothetical protein